MSPIQEARKANFSISLPSPPVAVFVGGTAGIGRAMAQNLAKYTKGNAHIIIIGRNKVSQPYEWKTWAHDVLKAAAEVTIASLPTPTLTDVKHEFILCDVTLMKNVETATVDILKRFEKINYLVLTTSVLSMGPRDETAEGIDKTLAVHYYARWLFIQRLLPGLTQAKAQGEDAKVLSVLAAGMGREIDLQDLGLKKTHTFGKAQTQGPVYNDLMLEVRFPFCSTLHLFTVCQEFASQNPDMTFIHSYPGFVRTNQISASPSTLLRVLGPVLQVLIYPLSTSAADSGDFMLAALMRCPSGVFSVGPTGKDTPAKKKTYDVVEAKKKLWDHTSQEITRALSTTTGEV